MSMLDDLTLSAHVSANAAGARMNDTKPNSTEEEREYARALMLALDPFRNIRSTMPLQYVFTYLMVVADEGKGVTEYAKDAGVSPTVMTRHLLDIGDRNRADEKGFGLVTQKRDVQDLRRHRAFVTNQGKALMASVVRALKTATRRAHNQNQRDGHRE